MKAYAANDYLRAAFALLPVPTPQGIKFCIYNYAPLDFRKVASPLINTPGGIKQLLTILLYLSQGKESKQINEQALLQPEDS